MAGKTRPMSQIKQLLRLHQQGKAKKEIARILGISKNTVKSYLHKYESSGYNIDDLLELDDPVLESKFHLGNPSYKEHRYEFLKKQMDYYVQELKRNGVTRLILWEEYKESNPNGYSFSQFCYHLHQHQKASKPTAVLHHEPSDKLFIDFAGKQLSYVDIQTGEIIKCQVFVACLPYSDYAFAMAVKTQGVEDFIYAISCCLSYLGGVPRAIVPDNLKSAVIKSDRYEPELNVALDDLANHYGTTIVPARVRSREEKFLADEKHLLQPLPKTVYEMKFYKEYTVAPNNHICLFKDRHYYSVPYIHVGRKAMVIYTRSTVSIYVNNELVAVHARSYTAGQYTSVKEHLCSNHQHWLSRSPDYYMEKAKRTSDELYNLFVQLFQQGKYPEQLYRTCDGLLRLQRDTEPEDFAQACKIAIELNRYSYTLVRNLIKNKVIWDTDVPEDNPLPKHQNVRGRECYK
ncbi:IS21 family transposase [Xiashengella succiniciproducens]|jgi:transposase|uniref:IS21 family transposase n=1 Tax=Xiashengella succiniciproducens TaxID=2949635 RepID=A0A9J6ZM90_9BACT|nr:IS21 family transposase [Alkaliflexus sp. Ai-910]URW78779.1 IS21 family transposase [Alkaliflexus sp. Ai-910]